MGVPRQKERVVAKPDTVPQSERQPEHESDQAVRDAIEAMGKALRPQPFVGQED